MFRTVVVDDETKALERLSRLVGQTQHLSLAGSFSDPEEAMAYIVKEEVEVVFLDIEMPAVSGLELAEQIFEVKPDIDVVFVTAYDQYALQAFQVHATGYLLKPIALEDIEKQVTTIIRRHKAKEQSSPTGQFHVQCLGNFVCYPQGPKRERLEWRTKKAEELFSFLLHYGGKPVGKEKILDTLWPEFEPEKAAQNLHATSWYIRNALCAVGCDGMFLRKKNCYLLDMAAITCDADEFTALIEHMVKGDSSIAVMEQALTLYQGQYLDGRSYEWAVDRRLQLENDHERLQYTLAEAYRIAGRVGQSLTLYKTVILNNPLANKAYEGFIGLSLEQGDKASALLYYKKYSAILDKEMGLHPPENMTRMIESIQKKKA